MNDCFKKIDNDHNGVITLTEFKRYLRKVMFREYHKQKKALRKKKGKKWIKKHPKEWWKLKRRLTKKFLKGIKPVLKKFIRLFKYVAGRDGKVTKAELEKHGAEIKKYFKGK